jgi:uncharacterized protein GlcG (DUF336 family)
MIKLNKIQARWAGAGSLAVAAALLVSTSALQPSRAQGTLPERPFLPLSLALDAANAAMSECSDGGYYVSVAVVDRAGNTKVLLRGDDSGPQTISGSQRKAFTAAAFGRPSGDLAESVADDAALAGLGHLDDRVVLLGGGLPIRFNNQVIGGIGVAGAPSGQIDEDCALVGIESIGADMNAGTATPEATGTIEATGTVEATGTPLATSTARATGTITATGTVTTTTP